MMANVKVEEDVSSVSVAGKKQRLQKPVSLVEIVEEVERHARKLARQEELSDR